MLMNQNNANTSARSGIDTMIDKVRGNGEPTTAAASDIIFADSSVNAVRYWAVIQPDSTLRTTTSGLPSGGTIVASGAHRLHLLIGLYHKRVVFIHSAGFHRDRGGNRHYRERILERLRRAKYLSSAKLRQIRFSNANGF